MTKTTIVAGLLVAGVCSSAVAAPLTAPLTFVGIAPCRIIDTRGGAFSGAFGPPALVANASRTFQITGTTTGTPTQCGIPDAAVAISVNFTVTGFAGQGDIRVYPAGGALPNASILNFQLENIANATSVPLGPSGSGHNGITVRADAVNTELIADVNGYYLPSGALASGQTLRGTWGSSGDASAAGIFIVSPFTFDRELASAPTPNFIPQGSPATVACPGSPTNPTATPGNLCIYESTGQNRTFTCALLPGTVTGCGTATYGSGVVVTSNAAGQFFSYGTWAVTAP